MVRKIEIVSKIIKIGNSKGITIEKKYLKYLDLDVDDIIKITIEKVEKKEKDS